MVLSNEEAVDQLVAVYKDNTVGGKTSIVGVADITDLMLAVPDADRHNVLLEFEQRIRGLAHD